MLRTVESIIAQSSVNLYFMTAFHPSSKRQVDEQTSVYVQTFQSPPNCLLKAAFPLGPATLNLFF